MSAEAFTVVPIQLSDSEGKVKIAEAIRDPKLTALHDDGWVVVGSTVIEDRFGASVCLLMAPPKPPRKLHPQSAYVAVLAMLGLITLSSMLGAAALWVN